MTGQNLTDLLECAVDQTHVGPPPLKAMLARSHHVRRRRTVLLAAAASAAVVVVVVVSAVLSGPGINPQPDPAPLTTTSPGPPENKSSTALNGTWTVRSLVGANGQSVLTNSYAHKVLMTFKNGKMTGTTGCNGVFGTYRQSGEQGQDFVFSRTQLGSTRVKCSDEPPLVTRLLAVRHASGSGDVRYLHAANWMIIAELRRP